MKWLNGYRMRLVVVGVVAAIVIGGTSARADFVICDPMPVDEPINCPDTPGVQGCSFLHDGLKLYFTSSNRAPRGIWVSERESVDARWGEPVCLAPYIDTPWAWYPAISPDDLELYFIYGQGQARGLMRSTRASKDEPWGPASRFTELGDAWALDFSPDGLTVYFDSYESPGGYGGTDIRMATRETVDAPWREPVNLGPNVNGPDDQSDASISNDGLVLFFNDATPPRGIRMCVRASTEDDWGPAVRLGPAVNNVASWQGSPEISPDGSVLYFDSPPRSGYPELFWQVSITPIVDFTGDGMVDLLDLLGMIEYWGTDHSLYDIGPIPWGDGVVDAADLEVLMSYYGHEMMIDLNVPKTSVVPIIDGQWDAVWNDVNETRCLITDMVNTSSAPPENSNDLSAIFKATYDDNNFYIFVEVQDSVIDYEFSNWQGDGIEIYFDGDSSRGSSYDGVNDNQIRITVGDVELADIGSSLPVDGAAFKVLLTDLGYNIEASFPLARLQISPDKIFGFEVQINDNDSSGGRQTMLRWHSDDNDSWQNPSLFGVARLVSRVVGQ